MKFDIADYKGGNMMYMVLSHYYKQKMAVYQNSGDRSESNAYLVFTEQREKKSVLSVIPRKI